jgi:PAS domain S-box-containing protein
VPAQNLSRVDIADATVEETAIMFVTPEDVGTIVFASRQAEQIFGYWPGALENEPLETLIPTDLRESHKKYRAMFHANPMSKAMKLGRKLSGLRRDGSVVTLVIGISQRKIRGEMYDVARILEVSSDEDTH